MTKIWTANISYNKPDRLNITVKDTHPDNFGWLFAPSWELVCGHKAYTQPYNNKWAKYPPLDNEGYKQLYYGLIRSKYRQYPRRFLALLEPESITLCCYCAPFQFCHRKFAADILEKIGKSFGLDVVNYGEHPVVYAR